MTNIPKKAYNRCLACPFLGDGCDGPNTLSMTLDRWCEWCRDLKRARSLTNADVSELSGVSITTVNRIMSGNAPKDIKRATASDINRVLVGSEGQWPCAMASDSQETHAAKDLDALRAEYETYRRETQAKLDHLRSEVEHLRKEAALKSKLLERFINTEG